MRNANRFYRGEPLTAARLNDLVEAANRFGSGDATGRRPVRTLTVKNESGAVVPRFRTLEVSGFWRPAATRDEAVERFAASGIEVVGKTPTGALDAFLIVATEPIPPGEFGPATPASGALFLAEVVGANDGASFGFATPATDAANAGKLVASSTGPFRIVARSGSGACLLTPENAETRDPFVIDYVERQPTYFDRYIVNNDKPDAFAGRNYRCYLYRSDLYERKNATLAELFDATLTWDVCSDDWTGRLSSGIPAEDRYQKVLTPLCCGLKATLLTAEIYDGDDDRTYAYRNRMTTHPPRKGRAYFPYKIFVEWGPSWRDAEDERIFSDEYSPSKSSSTTDVPSPGLLRYVLDHPRRRFANFSDVPEVFLQAPSAGERSRTLCPVCYAPTSAVRTYGYRVTAATDAYVEIELLTRPFKNELGDQYRHYKYRLEGASDYVVGATGVVEMTNGKITRVQTPTGFFGKGKTTPLTVPVDFAANVDGATVSFSWAALPRAARYFLHVVRSTGESVAAWAPTATSAVWIAQESGDYVAFLCAADEINLRSNETSVAFSVVVPAT